MQTDILKEIFEKRGMASSDHPAAQIWIDGQRCAITYKQLFDDSKKIAWKLLEAGIMPGDRVVLLAESRRIEWITALFAVWHVGATAVLLDSSMSSQDFQFLIARADCRAVLTTHGFYRNLKNDKLIPFLDIQRVLEPFSGSVRVVSPTLPPTPDPDLSVACLIFTSGTTGQSQGVMLSHDNILFVALQSIELGALKPTDQILGILPLNHVFGLVNIFLCTLLVGATVTFVEKIRSEDILQTMQNAKITTLAATPRILEIFYRRIRQQLEEKGKWASRSFDALAYICGWIRSYGWGNPGLYLFQPIHKTFGGSLIRIISGAAPLSPSIFHLFENIGWTVIEGYGLTETAGIVACNTMQHRIPGSVGKPVDGVKLSIAHPNAAGEGEICIIGPNVMQGYFRDANATNDMVYNGILHTGDLGFLDKEGDLIISGRIKELIVTSGGKKAMPTDVERRYGELPGVNDLSVVGIKSRHQMGDEIHAAIVLDKKVHNDASEALKSIERLLSERSKDIPEHLRIQHIHIVDQIPKTSTMKVKRGQLKELLSKEKMPANTIEDNIAVIEGDELTKNVVQLLSSHISARDGNFKRPITLDSSLQFDLSIDSLDRMELMTKLDKTFQIKIDDAQMHSIDQVSDLVVLVRKSPHVVDPGEANKSIEVPPKKGKLNSLCFDFFKLFSECMWSTKIEGIHNIPHRGPFILCANHQSYLDAYWIYACLPLHLRQEACCVARKELSENWWTALLAKPISIIPADRDGDALPAINMSLAVLKGGRSVLIFPEGNRTRGGEMRPFRRGAAHLAIRSGAPIVPIWIDGAFQIFPRHKLTPNFFDWKNGRRFPLRLRFGKPIYPQKEIRPDKATEESLILQVKQAIENLASPL